MPLCSNSKNCRHQLSHNESATALPASAKPSKRCLTIGLVNNMPDTALEATERQFRSLLASSSDGFTVRLLLYALPDVPRSDAGKRLIANSYGSIEDLFDTQLDGLIITGAEPRAASLGDEPYWDNFTRVLEWARDNTQSTIFSCLAAHAAVLQMDGIRRVRSQRKHFGIFEHTRLSDHRILSATPERFQLPHSRWNGISEDDLAANGYTVLTRTEDAGIDIFVKRCNSLFVFFQSHPEYESDSLLREYRRDVGRYLKGESEVYPDPPASYFDRATSTELDALRNRAIAERSDPLYASVSSVIEKQTIANSWNETAVGIYKNWLQYLQEQKTEMREPAAIVKGSEILPLIASAMPSGLSEVGGGA